MFHVKHHATLNNTNPTIYIKSQDFLVSGESFSLILNEELQMLETSPQPGIGEIAKYYESDAYISHTDSKRGVLNTIYQLVKSYSLRRKVVLINRLSKSKGSLLDVGAGTGDFLLAASTSNWQVQGVEVNASARKRAHEKNLDLKASLDEIQNQTFDVITLWHVLEHLHDLEGTIARLKLLLNENGILIIAVPNYNSFDAQYYKSHWAAFDVPRHLWHFSQTSIRKLFQPDLKLLETKPMIFDSFYVSLLSEKYKSGNAFSLKALWIGFKSNWLARSSSEYSSLIYCFQKPKRPF